MQGVGCLVHVYKFLPVHSGTGGVHWPRLSHRDVIATPASDEPRPALTSHDALTTVPMASDDVLTVCVRSGGQVTAASRYIAHLSAASLGIVRGADRNGWNGWAY